MSCLRFARLDLEVELTGKRSTVYVVIKDAVDVLGTIQGRKFRPCPNTSLEMADVAGIAEFIKQPK